MWKSEIEDSDNTIYGREQPRYIVSGRLCQSVAGRGLMSGSRRNEVPKGGWSEAELWQSLPETIDHLIECKGESA